ncbi:MAG: hypothetical protein CME45_07045 [Halieaceae bacterium]|nr:hypothetical protein [Halieaceae bacterium]
MTTNLSVGIVTYKTNKDHLKKCLGHLSQAVDSAKKSGLINGFEVILISNSPSTDQLKEMFRKNDYYLPIRIIENTKNTGFATAQNQILETISSDVHLILNPDAFLDKDSITEGLKLYLLQKNIALLGFFGQDGSKEPVHLAKRYPTVLALIVRGLPTLRLRRFFKPQLDRYEYRDKCFKEPQEVTMISGCAVLANVSVLKNIGGFDQRFFLYFEDFDLSLRAAEHGKILCSGASKVTHLGGRTSSRGALMIFYFIRSAIQFYRRHGLKLF